MGKTLGTAVVLLAALCLAGWSRGETSATLNALPSIVPPATPVSYSERQKHAAINQPTSDEAFGLPLILAGARVPVDKMPPGQTHLWGMRPELPASRYLWTRQALRPEHAHFLTRFRATNSEAEREGLIGWCEQNSMPECAEYLLRQILIGHQYSPSDAIYTRCLTKWRPYGRNRISPYTLIPPVTGQWQVMVDHTQHHQNCHCNTSAYDLVKPRGTQLYEGEQSIYNYYGWEQPVVAVADGVIVAAIDTYSDYNLGRTGGLYEANYLQLDCGGGVFCYYGHLRQRSLRVRVGDRVQQGEVLGLVGNSGLSDMPHLHFSMMDADGFSIRGRYRMEVWTTAGWYPTEGIDLEEGWHFRPQSQ
jgi:hypothetical protein